MDFPDPSSVSPGCVDAARLGLALVLLAAVLPTGALAARDPGQVFKDCADCQPMVVIPAGHILIGADQRAQARDGVPADIAPHELPRHRVDFARPFALGQTFVTRGAFAKFVAAAGYSPAPGCNVLTIATKSWGFDAARSWRDPGFPQTDRDPVVCVSWPDAEAYAAWMAQRTGEPYRLPTEAEFEYAARAGSETIRNWGDGQEGACGHANVSGLERATAHGLLPAPEHFFQCSDGFVYTSPAASFSANQFGLYDMLGDVWQWTQDCYNPDHVGAPADGTARMQGDCGGHVDKGSSWVNSPHYLSNAARHKDLTDNRDTVLGFRLARDLAPARRARPSRR